MERQRAACGVFVTLDRVRSAQARALAAERGEIAVGAGRYPRVQLWSIEELFEGRGPALPALADPQTGRAVQPRML